VCDILCKLLATESLRPIEYLARICKVPTSRPVYQYGPPRDRMPFAHCHNLAGQHPFGCWALVRRTIGTDLLAGVICLCHPLRPPRQPLLPLLKFNMIEPTLTVRKATAEKPSSELDYRGSLAADADHSSHDDVTRKDRPQSRLLARTTAPVPFLALLAFLLLLMTNTSYISLRAASQRRQSPTPDGEFKEESRSSGQAPPACNCSSTVDDDRCCKRLILRAHKMGVYLLKRYFWRIPTEIIHPERLLGHRNSGAADYRHVVLTRPWYDAIVSGYLYHMSGRECWLDAFGSPRPVNKTFDWESRLKLPLTPPSSGRSLCSYLAEESEEDGMRAYVDYSVSDLYRGIVPHRRLVEETETDGDRHTLFICFGDLEDEKALPATHRRAMQWLYPGRPYAMERTFSKDTKGHGTSRVLPLRLRLRSLVSTLDRQHFDGIGENATKWFGCERDSALVPGVTDNVNRTMTV
jgi:hypothetical protein